LQGFAGSPLPLQLLLNCEGQLAAICNQWSFPARKVHLSLRVETIRPDWGLSSAALAVVDARNLTLTRVAELLSYPAFERAPSSASGRSFPLTRTLVRTQSQRPNSSFIRPTRKGVLAVRARTITPEMFLASAEVIASLADQGELVPSPLNPKVNETVTNVVMDLAKRAGLENTAQL